MDRRTFLAMAGAAIAAPARASDSAVREFRIIRDGDDIGSHRLDAMLAGDQFEIEITIRIAVKILGITAYRYEMDNREVWQAGKLISIDSTVNDDGTKDFARGRLVDDVLQVEGSSYTGAAPAEVVTTSYYATPFLDRRPWLSTQTGRLLSVNTAPEGRQNWWQVTGGLETKLGYDGRGEWTGCEFDAGGEPAFYEVTQDTGAIAPLWSSA